MTICGAAMHIALLESAAEEQHATAGAEVAVESVHLFVFDYQILAGVALGESVRFLASGGRGRDGSAEFARDHYQRAVQQSAFIEILNEARDGTIDLLFHLHHALASVLVHVETLERAVLIFHLDEAGAGFD